MQPHLPLLDVYRELIGRLRDSMTSALPRDGLPPNDPVRQASTKWKRIDRSLRKIDAEIIELGENVFRFITDSDLRPEARASRIEGVATVSRAVIQGLREEARGDAAALVDALRVASYPSRGPSDVLAEARLAGIKTDLRMVLDVTDRAETVEKLSELLERALGDDDALTVWLLADSAWPGDYLDSRGLSEHKESWSASIDQVLDQQGSGDRGRTRLAYRAASNPRTGVLVLNTLLGATMDRMLSELENWALTVPPAQADQSPFYIDVDA